MPSSEREIRSHTCFRRRAGWSVGRSARILPYWKASTICWYAGSVWQQLMIVVSVAWGATTHDFTGRDVELSVVDAGARDKASAMMLSFPAIHFTSSGWSRIFSRSHTIRLLSIWIKFLANITTRGLWSVTTSKRSIPLRKKMHLWTAQTIAVSSNSNVE